MDDHSPQGVRARIVAFCHELTLRNTGLTALVRGFDQQCRAAAFFISKGQFDSASRCYDRMPAVRDAAVARRDELTTWAEQEAACDPAIRATLDRLPHWPPKEIPPVPRKPGILSTPPRHGRKG